MGASLKSLANIAASYLIGLGLLMLPASNLAGQSTSSYRPVDFPDLPRFTLREIITGSNDTVMRIPGGWLHAAMAAQPESTALADYHKVAALSGVAPLKGESLESDRSQHVMGLYRREELSGAARRTLSAIRASIPGDSTRARFDHLFRPGGEWIVDLHDAALHRARSRAPDITWGSARSALAAGHWLDPNDTLAIEAVPRALYGLTVLAAADSVTFSGLGAAMQRADAASSAAVQALLSGYAESRKWYTDVLEFFLGEPWIPDGAGGRSLGKYVLDDWRRIESGRGADDPRLPEIRARLFGYPQAVPYYGLPRALFDHLIVPENSAARRWMKLHGQAELLRTLRRLPPGDTSLVLLQTGSESIRLTTVPRQSRESLNGFLEPSDVIAIDPGYSPLLALGTVVHEWQHLLFRRRQLEAFAGRIQPGSAALVELPGINSYLAEGFAEWSAERILAPLHSRWPLLALGELEKRAALASGNANDQHSIGYALVRTLELALRDPASTTRMLLLHAEDPAGIARQPALRQAWKKASHAPDRILAVPARKILIPEVTFTVEDGFPDVISSRIVVPASKKKDR